VPRRWYGLAVVVVPVATTAVAVALLRPPAEDGWTLASALASGLLVRLFLVFVVGPVHAAGNATTDGSGFVGSGFLPRLYPEETVGPVHLLASAALGLMVLAVTRARLGRPAPSDASAVRSPAFPGRPRRADVVR
jgi:hypothetical protein